MGYLAVAHILSVHPHIEAGIHTLEVQVSLRRRLILFPGKMTAVSAAGIFMGHIGGIQRERIVYICILMPVIPMHLPYRGHGNRLPALACAVLLQVELLFQIIHTVIITEIPLPVQQSETLRLLSVLHQIPVSADGRDVVCPVGHGVLMEYLQIFKMLGHYHTFLPILSSFSCTYTHEGLNLSPIHNAYRS